LQFWKQVIYLFIYFFQNSKTYFYHVITCYPTSLKTKPKENKNTINRNMETTRCSLRKQVCLFRKVALKTRTKPISSLSAQCRTVAMICGSPSYLMCSHSRNTYKLNPKSLKQVHCNALTLLLFFVIYTLFF
jgi:hypothetical protein